MDSMAGLALTSYLIVSVTIKSLTISSVCFVINFVTLYELLMSKE